MKISYIDKNFSAKTERLIALCNNIIDEYAAQGFDLTLRQLYYQLVARDYIPNKQKEYKRLSSILSDARLAGLVDWESIIDRTRSLRGNSHWTSPKSILRSAIRGYAIDKWQSQPIRVEVWIEKDALIGVIAGVCQRQDVDYFACRGYNSQSEMWGAAQRLQTYIDNGQVPYILHLGDHDPSGMDMSRDIVDRINLFLGPHANWVFERLALNPEQVAEYNPPPNPTKLSDSRSNGYISYYGSDSWELDALDPAAISELIEDEIIYLRDDDLWNDALDKEASDRLALEKLQDYL